MAQGKPFTPEKRLLKLIESQDAAKNSNGRFQRVKHRRIQLFSLAGWISRFSFSKDRLKNWLTRKRTHRLDLRAINRILILIVSVLFVYSVLNLYKSTDNLERLPDLEIKPTSDKAAIESSAVLSRLKDKVSYYLERAGERDIFKMGVKKPTAETKEVPSPTSRAIAATANLRLVGISWSKDPDAMIEDKKALKTFFVKKGEMIGNVKVESIFKDKVILSFEGERVELR